MNRHQRLGAGLALAIATGGLAWVTPDKTVQAFMLPFPPLIFGSMAFYAHKERRTAELEAAVEESEYDYGLLEIAAYHEARADQLYNDLAAPVELDHEQPALPGAHIHQGSLPTPPTSPTPPVEQPGESGESVEFFNLEWLLKSNSAHCLLVGDTGSGKTTLARHLIEALNAKEVQVLDADDDDRTWTGFPVIGEGDDWQAIDQAMAEGLEEFKQRKPNGNNPTKVWVFEEMPDLIAETKKGAEFVSRLARRGRKRQIIALGITQDSNTGGIGLSQPVQKCFTRIFLQSMAQWALVNVANRQQRPHLSAALAQCKRPALVEFRGTLYPWDVPTLSNAATAASVAAAEVTEDAPLHPQLQADAIGEFQRMFSEDPDWVHAMRGKANENGVVSVRDFQQSGYARAHGLRAEQIRAMFVSASRADYGIASTDGSGQVIGFNFNP